MSDTHQFIFEIGTEELPPTSLYRVSQAFTQAVEHELKLKRLSYHEITAFASPRRLAFFIDGLEKYQPSQDIARKGPALKIALDSEGNPTKAGLGFAKSVGVAFDELQQIETEEGAWLSFEQSIAGQSAKALLPEIAAKALSAIPIAKSMRWGSELFSFIRPVHWLLTLLDQEVIAFDAFGVKSDRATYGHRFHANRAIPLEHAKDYENTLETQGFVIPSYEKRKEKIRASISQVAASSAASAVVKEDLLEEVTALVEWPVALKGQFETEYLSVPKECLISTMEANQKYFSLVKDTGSLYNEFIFISNIESKQPEIVIEGNERVIRPRLADAKFFYETDKNKPLSEYQSLLKSITFQNKLGSLWDKSNRLIGLTSFIAKELNVELAHIEKSAQLCKADLVTQMVGEFPNLQGTMGKYYALASGEPDEVAIALEEHYLPRFHSDKLPETELGICLSLADKLDTLAGNFSIGNIPTGDKDPFGIRRYTLGIIRICIEKKLNLDLIESVKQAIAGYPSISITENTENEIIEFMIARFRHWYKTQSIPTEIIQSIEVLNISNPLDFDLRVKAVETFLKDESAQSLAIANKRVANILKKDKSNHDLTLNNTLLVEPEEIALASTLVEMSDQLEQLLADKNYSKALQTLAKLKPKIDAFFDKVMIMSDDPAIKMNRMCLLRHLHNAFLKIADISYLTLAP